jgi:glycosyltransferase involved in cell wall biosynthesis
MRIGYFKTEFPHVDPVTGEIVRLDGGGGSVALNLALQMARRGHEVVVFTSSDDGQSYSEEYGGVEIVRYRKAFTIGQAPMSLSLLFRPHFTKRKLDIVHTHMGNLPAPLVAYWYARSKGIPLVTTYHNDCTCDFGSAVRRFCVYLTDRLFYDMVLSGSDRIIGLSEQSVEQSEHLERYAENVTVVRNGIDLRELEVACRKDECRRTLGLPRDATVILFVGALLPIKGLDILLEAMQRVLVACPEAYLVIVGDGAFRAEFQARVPVLGIEGNTIFTGPVYGKRKAMYFNAADIFVLPSISEAFGLVLLEASACGLPLVVSALKSLQAIVRDGYNGLYVNTGDYVDLAEKLIYLVRNADVRHAMGECAREALADRYYDYSWERNAELTEQVYREVLEQHARQEHRR